MKEKGRRIVEVMTIFVWYIENAQNAIYYTLTHTHTAPADRECGGGVGPDPELFGDLRDLTRGGTGTLVPAGCHLPPGLRWSQKR